MSNTGTLVAALEQRVTLSPALRAAFLAVDRGRFVPSYYQHQGKTWVRREANEEVVYQDRALVTQVQAGLSTSSSSQPSVMAVMLEALTVEPGQRVLEIGTGTGYNAALLSHLVGHMGQVVSLEVDEALAKQAREQLHRAGVEHVEVVCADGEMGYAAHAPYDRLIGTASFRALPPAWQEQLAEGGVLVGNWQGQLASVLVRLMKQADGSFQGTVLPQPGFFMQMRGIRDEQQPVDWTVYDAIDAEAFRIDVDLPALFQDQAFLFYLQACLPWTSIQMRYNGGPLDRSNSYEHWLVDRRGPTCLVARPTETGSEWIVEAHGQLWSEVQHAYHCWQERGQPQLSAYRLVVMPAGTLQVILGQERFCLATA